MRWHLLEQSPPPAFYREKNQRAGDVEAVGNDLKGKISLLGYALGIGLAFVHPWMADALYAAVAMIWLVPDTRIEKGVSE